MTAPRLGKGKEYLSLDDLFILVAATSSNAILVSQDKFRDIVQQESTYEQFSSSNDTRYRYYTEDSRFCNRFVTLRIKYVSSRHKIVSGLSTIQFGP